GDAAPLEIVERSLESFSRFHPSHIVRHAGVEIAALDPAAPVAKPGAGVRRQARGGRPAGPWESSGRTSWPEPANRAGEAWESAPRGMSTATRRSGSPPSLR